MKLSELIQQITDAVAKDITILDAEVITQTRYDRYEDSVGTQTGHEHAHFIIEEYYEDPKAILDWIQKENGYEELNSLEEYLETEDGKDYRKVFAITNNVG